MNLQKVVFLYSEEVENQLNREQFEKLWGENCRVICVEKLREEDLSDADAVVYAPGKWVCEDTFGALCSYYKKGGTLLLVGCRALSQPYIVRNGETRALCESVDYIRALGPIEQYVPIPKENGWSLKTPEEEFTFSGGLMDSADIEAWKELSSTQLNLARTEKSSDPECAYAPDARAESALELVDADGHVRAVPISVVTHFTEGTLILFNFTPENPLFYSQNGAALLRRWTEYALRPKVRICFETESARVNPGEDAVLDVKIERLHQADVPCRVEIELKRKGSSETLEVREASPSEQTVFSNLESGQYRATLRVFLSDGTLLARRVTGFFVMTGAEAIRSTSVYPRISIHPEENTEYCLQEGKPVSLHGTTYFVTDAYRRCFMHFNAELCDEELKQIREAGFNVLRTGNWQENVNFYGQDGECNEKALRNLEAFFLLAAKHRLSVQFVLGSCAFNNWDRNKDPLHNPEIRSKVMRVIRTFCTRFAEYPNVMLDIINEPSYSYRGGWKLGRPSLDPCEKKNWSAWLRKKYGGDLAMLHDAWRCTSASVPSFEEAPLPEDAAFDRYIARTERDIHYASVTDFYEFARESYSDWVREIRTIARECAPQMVVMMGRDESIRIPSEQDEIACGNIDFANWHQWITNSISFMEYYLNKVRGVPCCGQELGVYQQENGRGFKSLDDDRRAAVLEKKLLYSFGNWLQWQMRSDPYLSFICETTLGLCRADGTETPSFRMTSALSRTEEEISPYLKGYKGNNVLTLHPTYFYFSMNNPLAIQGVRCHALTLNYRVRMQDDLVLEHLFTRENQKSWGNPDLIFVPCAQMMADRTWQLLLELMREEGKTVLLCGTPDRDEFFRPHRRLAQVLPGAKSVPLYGNERIRIDGRKYDLDFRRATDYAEPGHALEKAVLPDGENNDLTIAQVGKGKLILCPLPIQLSESADAVEALYRFALRVAGCANPYFLCEEKKPAILIYPMAFEGATVYTLVNEGGRDSIRFVDLASGKTVETEIPAQRGCKLCVTHEGTLPTYWAHEAVRVGEKQYPPRAEKRSGR